jgi:hypothetical protein
LRALEQQARRVLPFLVLQHPARKEQQLMKMAWMMKVKPGEGANCAGSLAIIVALVDGSLHTRHMGAEFLSCFLFTY